MKHLTVLLLIIALLYVGCSGSNTKTSPSEKNGNTGTPEETMQRYADALAKNDVETALSLYSSETFQMTGISESDARQVLKDQLRNQEVPVFSNGSVKVTKVVHYAQVDYEIGGKLHHLLLKETPEGWKISGSMLSE